MGSSQTSVPCIAGLGFLTAGPLGSLRQGLLGAPPASGLSENKQHVPLLGCPLRGGLSCPLYGVRVEMCPRVGLEGGLGGLCAWVMLCIYSASSCEVTVGVYGLCIFCPGFALTVHTHSSF